MNVTTPLSKTQERKAVQYVEDTFLDITSSFKKRSEPSMTTLPTLSSYLNAMQTLLAFILRIPPVDPSTPLRTTFLLRLTGDIMNSVTGYPPDMADFRQLLDFMDDLDQAWVAVLRSQIWDPTKGEGVDLIVPVDLMQFGNTTIQSTPASQTERTRLRSLLLTGTAGLEEWLAGSTPNGEDYELQLEREGLLQEFNDLFANTLAEMGNFTGPPDNTLAVMETD
ncbi:hypothetical protein F5J12DRAFT_824189 [Pisolithus orientalis]|uniref:uncharacterized protein n=1 Tax=Pisolithus orientalis TaxID=936130 RepID=UPI002224AC1A|nr:uncharacterized protein F5J12DRAFT_824189 [Pisolithus orientalis]KAI6009552.1 hypothetical protein F5J12DRAFT_824189 [Pisolithus orientalis]